MSCRPILYTYEADTHCTPCALARFGDDGLGHALEDAEDDEGNPLGVLAHWWDIWDDEEDYNVTTCGTCARIICTVCGTTSSHQDRPNDSECWNCRTPWRE